MKQCLIVVDMQNDFIVGALGFEAASDITPVVANKIKAYQALNHTVIYTQDTHDDTYLKTIEGQHLPVKHCLKGSDGHAFHPSILAVMKPDELVFEKDTFPSLELGQYLKDNPFDRVEICGLVSSICVLSNAVIAKSALPNARIVVDPLATTSFDLDMHKKTLALLEHLHIEVKTEAVT